MNDNIDKFKSLVSDDKSGWLDKAKWRQENKIWLDISFSIAIKILSVLRTNKESGVFPKNQKELSKALDCSPQYVNKLLKGTEKLNIETISKIQNALNITIINTSIENVKMVEGESDQMITFNNPKFISARERRRGLKAFNYKFNAVWICDSKTTEQKDLISEKQELCISKSFKKSENVIYLNFNSKKEYSEYYLEQ